MMAQTKHVAPFPRHRRAFACFWPPWTTFSGAVLIHEGPLEIHAEHEGPRRTQRIVCSPQQSLHDTGALNRTSLDTGKLSILPSSHGLYSITGRLPPHLCRRPYCPESSSLNPGVSRQRTRHGWRRVAAVLSSLKIDISANRSEREVRSRYRKLRLCPLAVSDETEGGRHVIVPPSLTAMHHAQRT